MKKYLILIGFALIAFPLLFAQENNPELLNQRNQYFQQYKNFKDTMTIRTWINMVELSKRLESVVLIDNVLLDSLLMGTPNDANMEARLTDLTGIRDQLITDNARLNAVNSAYSKQKNNYIFIIVVISIILVFVVISLIKNTRRFKNMEKSYGKSNEKILNLKQSQKKELDMLKDEIRKLKEDQLLMENNANQMKKSYEILKSESMEGSGDDDLAEVRKEMEELGAEVSSILEEKQKLEEKLKTADEELLKYQYANKSIEDELIKHQSRNKSIEDELQGLLEKIKKE